MLKIYKSCPSVFLADFTASVESYLVLNLQCTDRQNGRLLVTSRMKKFRINSIIFISVIAVIFGCNVFYLVQLYESIRKNVEREVMAAMTDADIDDLMVRAGRAQALASNFTMQEEADSVDSKVPRRAEASTYRLSLIHI